MGIGNFPIDYIENTITRLIDDNYGSYIKTIIGIAAILADLLRNSWLGRADDMSLSLAVVSVRTGPLIRRPTNGANLLCR